MLFKENLRLGELLIANNIISDKQLEQALSQHQKVGEFLGRTVIKMGIASEEEVLPLLSKKLKIPYVQIKKLTIPPDVIKKVPAKFACHYELIPIKLEGKVLTVALTDPSNLEFIDDLTLLLGYKINPMLAGELDVTKALKKYYGIGAETIEEMMKQTSQTEAVKMAEPSVDNIEELATDASIIKFVNQILLEAYRDRATDIHIEPYEDELRIRYRIDGILHNAKVPKSVKHFREALVSRIKIMASLNIAERRMPQDGRIKVKIGNTELDLRISVLPTSFGESVNIRLLSSNIFLGLETLGLSPEHLQILESVIYKPHGIILLTGPTGSGKTTTLYACLSKI
ncbi:Flp pilus assembly complex ATPase component TadA, partial [bacterium]|nr:Flp pilus assembly complex ATPase component TadA [bacterium]